MNSRYHRQIILPQFGENAQKRLADATVLIVGLGGLGSPVAHYLTVAGVGNLILVDGDTVHETNLHRQTLYSEKDLRSSKAISAKRNLEGFNSTIKIRAVSKTIDIHNISEIMSEADVVVDCTDNFKSRYLINDAAVLLHKPVVYSSIHQYEGQLAVFNMKYGDSYSTNYRDMFPEPPAEHTIPNCAEGGVLGTLAGIMGTMQANETIKILTGLGNLMVNQLFIMDVLTMQSHKIRIEKNPNINITKLSDYSDICTNRNTEPMVNEISVSELKKWQDEGKDFQLIDVREVHEYEFANLDGELIPLGTVLDNLDKIAEDKDVVFHCRTGGRSKAAILQVGTQRDTSRFYNLVGGINAYAEEIDPSIPKY